MNEADKIKWEIEKKQRELDGLKRQQENIYNECPHRWSDPIYDPIYKPGYTDPGDPPGTMGVDWRGPCYISAKTIPRWKKICSLCGKEEWTTRTEEVVTKKPIW